MNPQIPNILSAVVGLAEKTLDRPTGDLRRQDQIEQLFAKVHAAADAATDQPRRFVNEWTLMLMTMLRKIERAGPFGDLLELTRATTIGTACLQFVVKDLSAALDVASAVRTTDHDFKPARGARS